MQRSGLVSIFIFIIGIALVFVFVLPDWNQFGVLKNNKAEKQRQLEEKRLLAARIGELSEKYESAKDDLAKLSLVLPGDSQLPELIVQFENMAKTNSLSIADIDFSEIAGQAPTGQALTGQAGNLKTVKTKLSLEGTYGNLKRLLDDIESNVRLMDVSEITFSSIDIESGVIKFSLDIKSYYLP